MRQLLCLVLVANSAAQALPSATAVAKAIDVHYNHLHSLQCRYTQRYRGLGMDRTESGTLTLRKPGRMRWAYDNPPGKLFLLDGQSAITYTPGDVQAQRSPSKLLNDLRSPLRFLLGHTELAKELDGLTLADAAGGYRLSGVPKGTQTGLRGLALEVDSSGVIHGMRLEESDGSTTEFTFTDLRENVTAPDSDFSFRPPPGVTVVDTAAPL